MIRCSSGKVFVAMRRMEPTFGSLTLEAGIRWESPQTERVEACTNVWKISLSLWAHGEPDQTLPPKGTASARLEDFFHVNYIIQKIKCSFKNKRGKKKKGKTTITKHTSKPINLNVSTWKYEEKDSLTTSKWSEVKLEIFHGPLKILVLTEVKLAVIF